MSKSKRDNPTVSSVAMLRLMSDEKFLFHEYGDGKTKEYEKWRKESEDNESKNHESSEL